VIYLCFCCCNKRGETTTFVFISVNGCKPANVTRFYLQVLILIQNKKNKIHFFLIFLADLSFLLILSTTPACTTLAETWGSVLSSFQEIFVSFTARVHGSTSCLIQMCIPHQSVNLLPLVTPGPRVVSHPYSIPLNWGWYHMVGTRATSPPPLYKRNKFRIGFNTSIPHWPTSLTQLLCWRCHTHRQTHIWCNPIRTQPVFMLMYVLQDVLQRGSLLEIHNAKVFRMSLFGIEYHSNETW